MTPHPVALAIALALATTLAACDSTARLTSEEHMQRAMNYETKGELASAVIELKNAVEKAPQNPQARLQLGQIYLEMGDGAAAEKELTSARTHGVGATSIAVPMAKALQLQGKHPEVLATLAEVPGLSSSGMAELHVVKGKSFLGLGEMKQAEEAFSAALSSQPDSPVAWEGQALYAYTQNQWDEATNWNQKILGQDPSSVRALALKGDIALARGDAKTAEAAYAQAFKLRPDYTMYRIALAIAQIGNGKFAEANKHLDTVLKSFPLDPTANYYRSVAAYQLKEYEAAKTHAENAINNQTQEDLRIRILAAAASYALGQQEAANKHIQFFLAKAPAYEPARKLQAAIQLKMGKATEAATSLKGVTSTSEEDRKLLNAVGLAAVAQGQTSLGLDLLQRNAQARPDDPLARTRLGIARSLSGDVQAGIGDLEQSLRMNPQQGAAEVVLALNHLRAGEADKALQAAERLQKSVPTSPDGHTLAGLAYIMKKQNAEARAAFGKALSIQPGNPNASHNLASLALLDGNRNEARRLYLGVLQKHPTHTQTLLRLADLDLQAGQAKAAEKTLSDALDKQPDLLPLRLALSRFYLARGKPDQALKLADDGLPKSPNDPGLLALKGVAQLQLGQPNLAVTALESAVKAAPNVPDAHFHLARAYEQLGNLNRAAQSLQTVLKLAPAHGPAKFSQARLLARSGKPEAAQKQLAELAARFPDDPAIPETRGDLAMAQNQPKEAGGFYKTALAKGETNFLNARLAASQMLSGDREGGFTTLRDWLKRYPEDTYTRGALADALMTAGQSREAGDHYAKILTSQPDNPSVINNLALLSLQANAIDKAMAYAQRALKLAPKQPQVIDTYAQILLRKGNTTEAIGKLREARDLASGDPLIQLHLAEAMIAGKQPDQARQVLRELLDRTPPQPLRQKAEELLRSIR